MIFENNVFNAFVWPAKKLSSSEEIINLLDSFGLIGKTIKRMKTVGVEYDQAMMDEVYRKKKYMNKKLKKSKTYGMREVTIDDPFLIEFEDGDVFEFDAPFEFEYKFCMNTIPWNINPSYGKRNIDANIIFSSCIGKSITSIEIKSFINDENEEAVSGVLLKLNDLSSLAIAPYIDFCTVCLLDAKGQPTEISYDEYKSALI